MQEYKKLGLINWQERKTALIAEGLLAIHLIYFLGNGFWKRMETILGMRIYLGILLCDGVFLLGLLSVCCIRLVTKHQEEGIFIRSIKLCVLLLIGFGVLGFLDTLLFF